MAEKTNFNEIRICRVTLGVNDTAAVSAAQLRGFIGNLFVDDAEFHHHSESSYHYPLIQYKKVNGKLMVLGLQQYADVLLNKASRLDRILTPEGEARVDDVDVQLYTYQVTPQNHFYEFATPWIALNRDNYAAFKRLGTSERKQFLERMLIGNTLGALKWLGVFVDHRLMPAISWYDPIQVKAHNNVFEAFCANFSLNIGLPDFVGLGKSVSKGFGALRQV